MYLCIFVIVYLITLGFSARNAVSKMIEDKDKPVEEVKNCAIEIGEQQQQPN